MALIVFMLFVGLRYGQRFFNARIAFKQAIELDLAVIRLEHIEDRVYLGEYTLGIAFAKVKITVKNNEITLIELLEHNHSNGHSGEAIEEDIINNQRLQVDAVLGSTISSKVILKAVEKALTS